jgi:hypothetical protein
MLNWMRWIGASLYPGAWRLTIGPAARERPVGPARLDRRTTSAARG